MPAGQGQVLPHPSDMAPRLPSAGQLAAQQPPFWAVMPAGQEQVPLQPSSWPARLPSAGQVGVQTQAPWTQRPFVPQPWGPQSQVSTQVPLLQAWPGSHFTPAQ